MTKEKKSNRLLHQSSPYLKQHAYNPVDWYPWGEEAFEEARRKKKLLLISIGYSACHWCHVMEKESFEDEAIAAFMNSNFVCIKVDREERPDVDHFFMKAVQLLTGRGGWPLNCIALPDKRPVFGGTYFRPEEWLEMLNGMAQIFVTEPGRLAEQADKVAQALETNEQMLFEPIPANELKENFFVALKRISGGFDFADGGTKGAPKFPMPGLLKFLAQSYIMSHEEIFRELLFLSLEKMAAGGIHDHVGGGFARYSVDAEWHVPHFEKMLYDNAQLLEVYSIAYQIEPRESFKNAAEGIISFLEREMKHPEGGYYAALDADSDGVEGKFYVWSASEVKSLLGYQAAFFSACYDIQEKGNWEGVNVLRRLRDISEVVAEYGLEAATAKRQIPLMLNTLFEARKHRNRPSLDDKVLLSWNSLLLRALVQAWQAFRNPAHQLMAQQLADYISTTFLKDHTVVHCFSSGESIPGFLDDYAFTADAFLKYYEMSANDEHIDLAEKLAEAVLQNFHDLDTGLFYYSSAAVQELPLRQKELTDNVLPSSNAVMVSVLRKLHFFTGFAPYGTHAGRMTDAMLPQIMQAPLWHYAWLSEIWHVLEPHWEIVICGEQASAKADNLLNHYLPNICLAYSKEPSQRKVFENRFEDHRTLIHVCRDHACMLPELSVEEVLKILQLKK